MKILNFGSLNLDYTYNVLHIAVPGETITSNKLEIHPGGKGLNQSVALARAGARVFHAGLVGKDGDILREACANSGVDVSYIETSEVRSGNAIIQVDAKGQNCIVLFPGANRAIEKEFIDEVFENFSTEDYLLVQNEISNLDYVINKAWKTGMKIILNPSPIDDYLLKCDLGKVYMFIMNEVEGLQITGQKESNSIVRVMHEKYPGAKVVLTLGEKGSLYSDERETIFQEIYSTDVKDTTGAGDTFTGYFITEYLKQENARNALKIASMASSIAVSKEGASEAIPCLNDVLDKIDL